MIHHLRILAYRDGERLFEMVIGINKNILGRENRNDMII